VSAAAGIWLPHLLQAAWQATAVGVLLLFVARIFPRANPPLRHALVLLALLKFAIPPMLPLPTGIFSAAPAAPHIEPVRGLVAAAQQPAWRGIVVALLLLHLAGFVFALARLLAEALRLRALRRGATAVGDGILVSPHVPVPLATGVFRPVILLPSALLERLSPRELEDVLLHEREHIRRRDVLLNWLQELVVALWWFHPLVHILGREARTLREECCDDALIASGRCEPAQYARSLLQAAAFAYASPVAAAIAETPHALLRRVQRLAGRRFHPRGRLGLAGTLLVLLAALILLPGLRISPSNRVAFDHATIHALRHGHAH
jgi:beta-lactamase regulating signal transducer with metallopeptidase domain